MKDFHLIFVFLHCLCKQIKFMSNHNYFSNFFIFLFFYFILFFGNRFRFSSSLEKNSFKSNSIDYLYFLSLGCILIYVNYFIFLFHIIELLFFSDFRVFLCVIIFNVSEDF